VFIAAAHYPPCGRVHTPVIKGTVASMIYTLLVILLVVLIVSVLLGRGRWGGRGL
jgi:hypothetical protein